MKKSVWRTVGTVALILLPLLAVTAFVVSGVGNASGATLDGDHWVDNLGTGVTAEGFANGNESSDCVNPAFLDGDYDLWSFVVNNATDTTSAHLAWNNDLSEWFNPSSVEVTDVTSQYGPYQSGDKTKHLWIATTPAGATLIAGRIEYPGDAGNERLSHTCAKSLIDSPTDEVVAQGTYDMEFGWIVDKVASWEKTATGYLLSYTVTSERDSLPTLMSSSLKVEGSFSMDPPETPVYGADINYVQDAVSTACDVDLDAMTFSCDLSGFDIAIDSTTGGPTGVGNVNVEIDYGSGTASSSAEVDWLLVGPTNVYGESATIVDDNATPSDSIDDRSTGEAELDYTIDWNPTGSGCVERTNESHLELSLSYEGQDRPSDSVTVRWCPLVPGLTIGYWGNKTGGPLVVSALPALKLMYPNVLGWLPNFTTANQVRDFMTAANCSGDCKTMFTAQFLAAAMNARNSAFADQSVIYGFACKTVTEILALANSTSFGGTTAERIAMKTFLDNLNNGRVSTCLTVVD